MGELNIHGYAEQRKNGGIMKLPSPDLIPGKRLFLGTNPYGGEVISGHYADPFIGHGVAGICLSHLALLKFFCQQD